MTTQEMTADARAGLIATIVVEVAPFHRTAAANDPMLDEILEMEFETMDSDTLAALAAALKS